MGFVPEIRHLMAEVHVIREQRLAGYGVRSGHHPVVRTERNRFLKEKWAEPWLQHHRKGSASERGRDLAGPDSTLLLRRSTFERRRRRGRRVVPPRSVHVEIGSQLRTQLGQNLLSRERSDGFGAQGFDHLVSDHQRILHGPWTW